jgi:hypothetical protein
MPLGKNRGFCVIRLTHIEVDDVIARAEWRGRGLGGEVPHALVTYVFASLPAVNRLEGQTARTTSPCTSRDARGQGRDRPLTVLATLLIEAPSSGVGGRPGRQASQRVL